MSLLNHLDPSRNASNETHGDPSTGDRVVGATCLPCPRVRADFKSGFKEITRKPMVSGETKHFLYMRAG